MKKLILFIVIVFAIGSTFYYSVYKGKDILPEKFEKKEIEKGGTV